MKTILYHQSSDSKKTSARSSLQLAGGSLLKHSCIWLYWGISSICYRQNLPTKSYKEWTHQEMQAVNFSFAALLMLLGLHQSVPCHSFLFWGVDVSGSVPNLSVTLLKGTSRLTPSDWYTMTPLLLELLCCTGVPWSQTRSREGKSRGGHAVSSCSHPPPCKDAGS